MVMLHEEQIDTIDILLEAGQYSTLAMVNVGIKRAFVG